MGSDHPAICPYGTVFECGDGKLVTLAVGSDKQFKSLCSELGEAHLSEDERFKTNPKRVSNRDACKEALKPMFRKLDRAAVLDRLAAKAVPCGAVNDMESVFAQPACPCLLYTSPSPRDRTRSRMPSSA
eukprot:TRINITY_DN16790_c0_g1_i3.p1 TRINITY_DN16790_c0_g1~~TRINITY_DN16790_c0_g1_i3.p1  ORF type:complete len:129 (-),score=32.06 TRINITY_DN16790_c0_g1_i3:24-410(-)